MPIGHIQMNGPAPTQHFCALGRACTLTLPGRGLLASNKVRILATGSCGAPAGATVRPAPEQLTAQGSSDGRRENL